MTFSAIVNFYFVKKTQHTDLSVLTFFEKIGEVVLTTPTIRLAIGWAQVGVRLSQEMLNLLMAKLSACTTSSYAVMNLFYSQ